MRDFLIVLIVLGSVPITLVRPDVGILMWFWLSLMNPHRLTWSYAQQFRVALVVGGATLIGWIISREAKRPPNSPVVYALAIFTFWVSLAALFSLRPDLAVPKWEEIIKILAMTFVTMCIMQSRERIHMLVWVIVVSLGFYGIKGGVFAILTGGHYRVWGPPGTFIEDNNSLALALIMLLPLMQYLRVNTENRWVKLGLLGSMGLTMISILASYSRGGLLALGVMLGFLWLKSRHKLITAVVTGCMMLASLHFLPESWYHRMESIENYQQDGSVQGRFDAWRFAYRLALDHPFTGGGQLIGTDQNLFMSYVPTAAQARAAHSIYFEVLGETGFVGLALFLILLATSFLSASNVLRLTRNRPDLAWARSLAAMIQVSFIGYAVGGAALSLGFFDLYYALIAVITLTQFVVRRELAAEAAGRDSRLGRTPQTADTSRAPATAPIPAFARADLRRWRRAPPGSAGA